jgi:hypothetical protein
VPPTTTIFIIVSFIADQGYFGTIDLCAAQIEYPSILVKRCGWFGWRRIERYFGRMRAMVAWFQVISWSIPTTKDFATSLPRRVPHSSLPLA